MQESKRGGPRWTIPGYVGVAASGPGDADNCRILVRDDVETLDSDHIRVPGGDWTWNGNNKPARVFPWVAVRWRGQVYVLVCVHRVPNGPRPAIERNREAWAAEHRALVTLVEGLQDRWPEATYVLGGDWNAGADEAQGYLYSLESLSLRLEAKVRIAHIDGFMVINGSMGKVKKLDSKFGSDGHRPVIGAATPA